MSTLIVTQAKVHLNISGSSHDQELQVVIDAAEAAVAKLCGPLVSTAVTRRVRGGGCALSLPVIPALSLTSVTPVDGAALTVGDLYLNTAAGTVTYNSGAEFPSRYYTVVYNAGRSSVPDDLLLGVKELVRHMWEAQRGPSRRPGSSPSDSYSNTLPGAAHEMPFLVTQKLTRHMQPGFA